MIYSQYWMYVPLVLGFIVVIITLFAYSASCARGKVFKEIKRNKATIQTLAEVMVENRKVFNGDAIKAFEYSKSFFVKSMKDLKNENYIKKKRFFNNTAQMALINAYKAFSVVSDLLANVEKVNTQDEIVSFLINFKMAANISMVMSNKVLELKGGKKK